MKLLIAIPSLDYIHVDFVNCLQKLIIRLKDDGINFDVKIISGTLVYTARDKLANHAIENGFTHVLWLDADMIFNDSLLDDLMFSGKPFVTGICHSRRKPFVSCVFRSLETLERFEVYPHDTFEIAGCGFACVLISTDILRDVRTSYQTCFLPTKNLGEDLAFCQRASSLGYKIYAEPSVRMGHIGHITIYPEDHERYMQSVERV